MTEEEFFLFYKSLKDFFQKSEEINCEHAYFYLLFDKKHSDIFEKEIMKFFIRNNDSRAINLCHLNYTFVPLNQIYVTNLDCNDYENLDLVRNDIENIDKIFYRLKNNFIEIKNIDFSLRISKNHINNFSDLKHEQLLQSYNIEFFINNKLYEMFLYSYIKSNENFLQSGPFYEKTTTVLILKGYNISKILSSCFFIHTEYEIDKNLISEKYKKQVRKSSKSKDEMSSKINHLFSIFKSQHFINEELNFFEQLCGYNDFPIEISFEFTEDMNFRYHSKSFYSLFVDKIFDLEYKIDHKMTYSFYKYNALIELEKILRTNDKNIILENQTIEMQKISNDEAINFKEKFDYKFVAVIEINLHNHKQVFYIFPTYFELSLEIQTKAIKYYEENKDEIFTEFYDDISILFKTLPPKFKNSFEDFIRDKFMKLKNYEIKAIFLDRIKYTKNNTFRNCILLEIIIYIESNLKNIKDEELIFKTTRYLNFYRNKLESGEVSNALDFQKLNLPLFQLSAIIFEPILLKIFEILRSKFLKPFKKSGNHIIKKYKIVSKKLYCIDNQLDHIKNNFECFNQPIHTNFLINFN